ncbi:MAG: M48 family metallopeptidase [Sediminibacterium sp.]
MKRFLIILTCVVCSSLLYTGCVTNAITGRSQLSLVSENDLQAMAFAQYKEFLSTNPAVPSSNNDAEMVKRVGNRIASAINQYYAGKGVTNPAANYSWEFNLVSNKEVNAWCMPGGKVVVYTGILPVTRTEAALAVVLGHEITHALFGHGKERMSQQMAAEGLGALGGVALSGNAKAANIFNNVYGVSAQYGALLPNSRKQELEADHYGLIFAAAGGYNPQEAVDFWTRMAAVSAGTNQTPTFMSDHPSDADRIQKIREVMPEALKYYRPK